MLRVGKIPYTNLFPIYYYLEEVASIEYDFIEGVPYEINRLLRDGLLDVSPSSSIEYLRRPERYMIIQGHSVSSTGPVGSILLFSKRPIETLGGLTVLYSNQSETSASLLKIILTRFYQIDCRYQGSDLTLHDGLSDHSAYLLIGDDALREALKWPGLFIYDLGDLWYRETGLPFVFALWIAGRGKKKEIESFKKDLDRARRLALNNLRTVARACPFRRWLDEEDLVAYWKGLSFDFDKKHMKGLELFRRYLKEMELI
jgi:chorismate dehydratase